MKEFAALIEAIDSTTSTNGKINALVHYLQTAATCDQLWMVAIFSHRRPKRPITSTQLKEWAAQESKVPQWLFDESYHIVGDLAETCAILLPENDGQSQLTLSEWMAYLQKMGRMKSDEEKYEAMRYAWQHLDKNERFIFNKLITGGFRIGVSQLTVINAIAKYKQLEPAFVQAKLSGKWQPDEMNLEQLLSAQPSDDLSKPYPFYLASPVEGDVITLGSVKDWQLEWKWDGMRGQIIKRGGQVFIWSRGEELVTDKFPELNEMTLQWPDGTVVDGEILVYKNQTPQPFAQLQTRIGRKNVSKKVMADFPVCFIAYDVFENAGEDIRGKSLDERRQILELLYDNIKDLPNLLLSEKLTVNTWAEAEQLRLQAREYRAEGLMIKNLYSTYKTGRKRGEWWKWKMDPLTIDAVMIYAQRGHGRRANLYTDFTFAVWQGDYLVPVAKAYSGLTDEEFEEVNVFIKQNTIESFGPVRSVKGELVFEIGFEAINVSPRHKSGVALRFPRILRWRKDKPAAQANTIDELKALINVL